jgi:hypothetical protein
MNDLNPLAVLAAAASSFLLGGLWYSPLMFLKSWWRETGYTEAAPPKGGHPARVFGVAFLFSLISAAAFGAWIGTDLAMLTSVLHGAGVGFAFVAASFGINYQFANRTFKLWFIDAGYHVLQFALYGLVFSLF